MVDRAPVTVTWAGGGLPSPLTKHGYLVEISYNMCLVLYSLDGQIQLLISLIVGIQCHNMTVDGKNSVVAEPYPQKV